MFACPVESMTSDEIARILKEIPLKLQSASVKDREKVIKSTQTVLSDPACSENVVRWIAKVLPITLPRYYDRKSQSYVKNLLKSLCLSYPDWTFKYVSSLISDVASSNLNVYQTKSTGKSILSAFSWSVLLLKYAFSNCKDGKDEFKNLIDSQAHLYSYIVSVRNKRMLKTASKLLMNFWNENPSILLLYEESISHLPESFHSLLFSSLFFKYLSEKSSSDIIKRRKGAQIEVFSRVIIGSKSRVEEYVISGCKSLLVLVDHNEFSSVLLPAINKALLRNPELCLSTIGSLIDCLSLDLSRYSVALGQIIASSLTSKDERVSEEASQALKSLAKQCSDSEPVKALIDHLFQIFNGSKGKISVAQHKIIILQSIGNFSSSNVTGNSCSQLAEFTCQQFVKILQSEVHEKTVVCCLEQMSLWCVKLTGNLNDEILKALETGLNKSTVSSVRTAYISLLSSIPSIQKHSSNFIPIFVKSVEKAVSQQTQVNVVTEGLSAICLLQRLSDYENNKDLSMISNILSEPDKCVFFSEKFILQASPEAQYQVISLCERQLMEGSNGTAVVKALALCLTNAQVRLKAKTILQRMLSSLHGTHIAISLYDQFNCLLLNNKIQVKSEENKDDSSNVTEIKPKHLIDTLLILCCGNSLTEDDKKLLAFHCLLSCHHPLVVSCQKFLWLKIVETILGLKSGDFVSMFEKKIVELLIDNFKPIPSYINALSTVVRSNPDVLLPHILGRSIDVFIDPEILNVSETDYAVYVTPEGELYDKSVITGKDEVSENIKNMKRESKAYTYKEQQEEIALRKEIEEKKRKEGKLSEPALTPKQREAIKVQLEKEASIRNKLKIMEEKVLIGVSLIECALEGDAESSGRVVCDIVPVLVRALRSPLAIPQLAPLYLLLRKSALSPPVPPSTALRLAHTTLTLVVPQAPVDPSWAHIQPTEGLVWSMDELSRIRISSPGLAYVLPMVEYLVNNSSSDSLISQAVKLLSTQANHRTMKSTNLFSPNLLPTKQMMNILIDIIDKTAGRVQQQAVSALLEVSKSVSGDIGCTNATPDQIDTLLSALRRSSPSIRDAALRSLQILVRMLPTKMTNPEQYLKLTRRIWVAKHDIVTENREGADKLWSAAKLSTSEDGLLQCLVDDLVESCLPLQKSAAIATATLLPLTPDISLQTVIQMLIQIYNEKNNMIPGRVDSLGRIVEKPVDTWEPRQGVAFALEQLAPLLDSDSVCELSVFYVSKGLGDRSDQVRNTMLAAALAAVDLHGKNNVNSLLPIFEPVLDKGPDCSSYDSVRQSVIILMGSLAKHLDKDDKKIKPIVTKLIDALATPSQQVQEAIANCLPALVPSIKDEAATLVNLLLDRLLNAESYGQRKGAAYGLAGIVKGMGILALKQLDIMNTLTVAIQDKKNYLHREGALFAFEMLCSVLGRLFEPYIVHVLPHLLLCFGDGNQYVREATDDCARVVMSKLSTHGVKLVLPSLLAALEKDSWRTKTGSVELLGAMAFCAPKQLSSCLPNIVPKLIEVLSDSHVKVQMAGAQALRQIGSVIRNPEIQAIVGVLLEALQNPSERTAGCLQTLLDTQFVHFIDAPSLALIMPVVQRAFQDRSTETRKMAAQIIGNMYSLTDQKDLTPYLSTIIPGLKTSLLDPVPEVRSVSARALGAMVRGMGEASFEDLLPWLMQTLTSEVSSVDRSGAAQGLSEVVGGLGVDKLHKLMPEIITTAQRADIAPHVKDGYIMMFIYMPVVFTKEFTPYIGEIIIPILKALADENEYVRDTALKAGQRIVNLYAESAITLLLPELERGLFDNNWRIRYSSVQLLGDLLYKISGVSGKMSTETANEDDNFGTEQSHKAIIEALGLERRNRVLAGLYMGRSDVSLMVRQAALHVWKVVVTNTPRTLREILPTLFNLLLGCLASTSHDKRQVAAKTLGDLVRKLGERVLPEIIPILEKGLQSDHSDQRQGVCVGLSEIMASTSRDMVLAFVNSLVPTVRRALCDPLPEVRHAAAKTFDSLHATVGVRALDDILPHMLQQLTSEDTELAEWTLDGLRQVMAMKSRVVLPYLVPQLTAPPANTKALSILASVASGPALTKYLHKILPALLNALAMSNSSPQELEYCQAVILSVNDEVGVRAIVDHLLQEGRDPNVENRRAAATLLCSFCTLTKANYYQYVPQLIRGLILLFTDSDPIVLQMAWDALNSVTKSLEPAAQISCVSDVRQAIKFATSDFKPGELLPGLCLPKGIMPVLPLFREAVLNGSPEEKEAGAQGLGEVISLTTQQSLQPSVIFITGPLIRILGDRFAPNIKAAVLHTLATLLAKVGVLMKQFLPQLQTTFLKALNDSNRLVRLKAGTALSHLIVIHTRPDPLFTEIHNAIKSTEDPAIRETMIAAVRGVIIRAGFKMSDGVRKNIYSLLIELMGHSTDTVRSGAAGCLGSLLAWLPPATVATTLNTHLLKEDLSADWTLRHGRSAALYVSLKEVPDKIYTTEYSEKIHKALISYIAADWVPIVMNGVRGCGYLFEYMMNNGIKIPSTLLTPFVRGMNHQSNDVKQLVARVCSVLGGRDNLAPEFLKASVPMLVNGTKEKNTYVKANSEISLVVVLKLRKGDTLLQEVLSLLDEGARESLQDAINKVRKIAVQGEAGRADDLDDTLLT